MNSIVGNTRQREAGLRSALLTAGSGPIANSTYRALTQYTDLQAVVLTMYKDPEPRWKKLRQYGIWYALQYFTSRVLYQLSGDASISRLLSPGVAVRVWESPKDEADVIEWLQNLKIDLVVVSDIHYILTEDFIARFTYCINVHPSLLPEYRGPHPIIWGLLDKSPVFGITLHLIDVGIDSGDIICQSEVRKPVLPLAFVIEKKLATALPDLIKDTIRQIQANSLHTRKQEAGFYLPLPTLANRRIRKRGIDECGR